MARPSTPTKPESLKPIVEAMIFAGEEPLGPRTLLYLLFGEETREKNGSGRDKDETLFDGVENQSTEVNKKKNGKKAKKNKIGQKELRKIIASLNDEYEESGRSFRIIEIAGGFHFATVKEYGEFVGMLSKERSRRRLSPAALETLSIVAYRQPVTKPEMEAIRGVNCDQVLLSLLERNLIAITGRADSVGKPLLYGTTDDFLRAFGLNSLSDLPKLRELEELMEDDAYSPARTQGIPDEVTQELLELGNTDEQRLEDTDEHGSENTETQMNADGQEEMDTDEHGLEDTDEHGSENTETQMNADGQEEMDTDEQRLEDTDEHGSENTETQMNTDWKTQMNTDQKTRKHR